MVDKNLAAEVVKICREIEGDAAARKRRQAVFADAFYRIRKARGQTLRAMGGALGVSFAYLSDLERGNRTPSAALAKKIREWAAEEIK